MKKFYIVFFIAGSIFTLTNSFSPNKRLFRSSGYALNFDNGATGAPFETSGQTCGSCHTGGSYNPTITTRLLNSSGSVVTEYTPGSEYRFQIIINATGNPEYGFQTTCVTGGANYYNYDGWSAALPTNVQNILTFTTPVPRNYVEQGARLTNNTINLSWTAPAAGTGTVEFYSIGNCVNADLGTLGDIQTPTSILAITEGGVIPVIISAFTASKGAHSIQLNWETQQETNHKHFELEHSTDGSQFTSITTIPGNGNSSVPKKYVYNHTAPVNGKNYYRLKDVSFTGQASWSNIISLNWDNKNQHKIILYPTLANEYISFSQSGNNMNYTFRVLSEDGKLVLKGQTTHNRIFTGSLKSGYYILQLFQHNKKVFAGGFVKAG